MADFDMSGVLGMINTLAEDAASATQGDKTVTAEVVKIKNPATGEYMVQYQDAIVSAFAAQPTVTYSIGDKVYVLVPEGNLSRKKIIIGYASAQSQLTYAEMQELTNFYVPHGPNWLGEANNCYGMDHKDLRICAIPRNKKETLYTGRGANYTDYGFARWPYLRPWTDVRNKELPSQYIGDYPWGNCYGQPFWDKTAHYYAHDRNTTRYPEPKRLIDADKMVTGWGENLEYIGVKAKFRTEFMTDHVQGRYGIRIELLVDNPAFVSDDPNFVKNLDYPQEQKERYALLVKELSFDAFTGNPYCYTVNTEQIAYFKVQKGVVKGLNRVCLFQNDTDDNVTDEEIVNNDMTVDYVPQYDDEGNLVWNPEAEVRDRNNIFATDIDIRWYEKINMLNSMFLVHISAEKGTHLANGTKDVNGNDLTGISEVILKAHLYYGGKDILDEDSYEVIWYRECPDYQSVSAAGTKKDNLGMRVADYIDPGWAPIFRPEDVDYYDMPYGMFVNEFAPVKVNQYAQPVLIDAKDVTDANQWNNLPADDLTSVHDAAPYRKVSFREIAIPKDKVPWEWYYTCVVVQKPKAQVTDNNGTIISSDNDQPTYYKYQPTTEDGVQGIKVTRDDSRYALHYSDVDVEVKGACGYSYMRIEDDYDLDYTAKPPQPATPWYGNWWYRADNEKIRPFDGNIRNLLGGDRISKESLVEERNAFMASHAAGGDNLTEDDYKEILEKMEKNIQSLADGEVVSLNGLVNITPYLKNSYVQFVTNAIDPYLLSQKGVGFITAQAGSIREITVGVLHKTMSFVTDDDLKIDWEGQQEFLYNYDGSAKSWYSKDGFYVEPALTMLKNTCGEFKPHFYGPEGIESEEIHRLDFYDSKDLVAGEGYTPPINTMLRNIYVEDTANGLARIHFGVRETYDESLAGPDSKNSFYLVIDLIDGNKYIRECKITFSKDGVGSNGTGWIVNIDACIPANDVSEKGAWAYTMSQYLHPLLIEQHQRMDGDYVQYEWKEVKVDDREDAEPISPLVLRPFIYRCGEGVGARVDGYDLEREKDDKINNFFDFPAHLGYWAQTVWDVRFPAGTEDQNLRYNSYLRLYKIGSNSPFSHDDWDAAKVSLAKPRGFDWANQPTYKEYEGVCAVTDSADGNKGAIQVRLNPNLGYGATIPPPIDDRYNFEHFIFQVCACTTIYRGCQVQDDNGNFTIDRESPNKEIVTVIYSYYPVDLLVVNNKEIFLQQCGAPVTDWKYYDNRMIDANWPRVIEYSATGISPHAPEYEDGLWFYFGKTTQRNSFGTGEMDVFPISLGYPGENFRWWPAYNLSPQVQTITYEDKGEAERNMKGEIVSPHGLPTVKVWDTPKKDENGNIVPDELRKYHWQIILQKYTANEAINPASPMFGVLSTYWKDMEQDPFKGSARFYRNQIFIMSRFSNNGVNVWDGQSIAIDTDNNTICAPTVAAGYKSPMGNDFTGVIMGIDKNQRKDGCYEAGITTNAEGVGNNGFSFDVAMDNRQYTLSEDLKQAVRVNEWMAGVYGYQQGIVTFGLMENGTAFFGRKDGGAQIVIDGSNGTIYGGGNGYMTSPTVNDPMWNSMRLTLTDLTRDQYKERTVPEAWDFIKEAIRRGWSYGQVQAALQFGYSFEMGGEFDVKADGTYVYRDAENKEHTISINDQVVTDSRAMTSVNIPGGSGNKTQPYCPDPIKQHNPVRLDFYESFAGILGYEEDSYRNAENRKRMPAWYMEVWETATVHRIHDLPYFLQDNIGADGHYMTYEDLPDFQEAVWQAMIDGKSTDTLMDKEWRVNYWNNALLTYHDTEGDEDQSEKYQRSTFGYGRASTTPAIEIGQHIPGLRPGILGWCSWERILRDLYIPGDRNFMVTYDGTMWAMNAIVIGNIIGSNIIGGRLQGAEIGIGGSIREDYQFQYIDTECNWPPLEAPLYHWDQDPLLGGVRIEKGCKVPAFYVDKLGNVSASSMRIFGGSIDIGTFHIRGKDPGQLAADNKAYGELIQYGMSDFVGVVHCYGNLGVGPNRNGQSGNSGGSNQGNFTQVKGQVAMGISYSEGGGVGVSVHEWVAQSMGMEQTDYGVKRDSVAPYMAYPGMEVGKDGTLEQAAFFGIDASPDVPENNGTMWQGHFWPMAWKYDATKTDFIEEGHMPGWFTTMNLFKSSANFIPLMCDGTADPTVAEGANYFRVGAFGTEFKFGFISKQWLDEDQVVKPDWTTYFGHIGITERNNGTAWAIGIQTWAGTPLIMNSSCQTAVRSIGFIEMVSNCISTEQRTNDTGTATYIMPSKDPANAWYSNFRLGWYCDETPTPTIRQNGKFRGHVWNGTVSITAKNGQPDYASGINNWGHFKDANMDAGIFFSSEGTNAADKEFWMWTMVDAMHIIQGNKNFADNDANNNEIWMKDDKFGINAKTEFWININKSAHENGQGKPGISIKKDEFILGTDKGDVKMDEDITFEGQYADENHQKNIYARFA